MDSVVCVVNMLRLWQQQSKHLVFDLRRIVKRHRYKVLDTRNYEYEWPENVS